MKIFDKLEQPVAVLGANGFIGKNLVRYLRENGVNVLEGKRDNLLDVLRSNPKTVFNCIAYGSHFWENDVDLIYKTNFELTRGIITLLEENKFKAYVHAGTSSEYGERSYCTYEDQGLRPNSHYAVSKAACSSFIYYMGHHKRLPVCNLRLYAVYGANDHPDKLIPQFISNGLEGKYPKLVNGKLTRDFIYIDDVCRSFVCAAVNLLPINYGDSFNIGTGKDTSICDIAYLAKNTFGITKDPVFDSDLRQWDLIKCKAHTDSARLCIDFVADTSFEDGFNKTINLTRKLNG
jgi:dolichol-phosphate mannosyltransferase